MKVLPHCGLNVIGMQDGAYPLPLYLHDAAGAPTGFAVDGSPTSTGGDFIWSVPTYTGHSAITGYYVYARVHGTSRYVVVASPASESVTIDDSFTPSTAYDMYVTATNAQGESPPSNVIQFATAA